MFQTLASSSNPSLHFTPLCSPSHHTHLTCTTPFPSPSLNFPRPLLSLRCQATVQDFATDTSSTRTSNHHYRSPASLYDILRVNRTASMTEIKTAYRTLAKLYHPDAAASNNEDEGSDGVDFITIHNAYETLSDPSARALYDLSLGFGAIERRGDGVRFSSTWSDRRYSRFYPTRRWETDQCW